MKKQLVLFLILAGFFSFVGCNNSDYNDGILQAGSYTIVCFGDSTTVESQRGIVYAQNLKAELPLYEITGKVINAGVPSDTTETARKRFEKDVLVHDPDLVIIQLGLNDSCIDVWRTTNSRVSLSTYISNLTFFTQTLKARGSKVVLMTTNPMGWTPGLIERWGHHPYDVNDRLGFSAPLEIYNPAVRDLAKAEDVPLIDVYQMYKDYDTVEGQDFKALLADGIHPNTAGHRLTTNELIKVITGTGP